MCLRDYNTWCSVFQWCVLGTGRTWDDLHNALWQQGFSWWHCCWFRIFRTRTASTVALYFPSCLSSLTLSGCSSLPPPSCCIGRWAAWQPVAWRWCWLPRTWAMCWPRPCCGSPMMPSAFPGCWPAWPHGCCVHCCRAWLACCVLASSACWWPRPWVCPTAWPPPTSSHCAPSWLTWCRPRWSG